MPPSRFIGQPKHRFVLACVVGLLGGCGSESKAPPQTDSTAETGEGVPADVPVLHRLTTVQIQNSLESLFGDEELPRVILPAEIPVGPFRNQALTRDATPFLVESLQRSLDAVAEHVVDKGWSGCDDTSAQPRALHLAFS